MLVANVITQLKSPAVVNLTASLLSSHVDYVRVPMRRSPVPVAAVICSSTCIQIVEHSLLCRWGDYPENDFEIYV